MSPLPYARRMALAFFKCPKDLVLLSEEDLLVSGLGSLVSQLDAGWPWVSHLGYVILNFLICTWICTGHTDPYSIELFQIIE